MNRLLLGLVLSTAILLPAAAEWNEPHAEGSRETAYTRFYPQARVFEYSEKDFDGVDLVVGYKKGADDAVQEEAVEGRVTRYRYEHKPRTSPLEIVRNYENALRTQGFATIVAGRVAQNPGLPAGGSNAAFGVFRLDRNGTPAVYVNVSAYEQNGPDDPHSDVTVVEIGAMQQKLQPQ
jgi:OmpA-OmpF porin, OOP family